MHALLAERGLVSYCPLNKVRKRWSDRIKLTEEPLFKSYVFVQIGEDEQQKVVNVTEDNAQTRENSPAQGQAAETDHASRPHENERLEAADDNNEVHPREPKVN